MLTPSRDATWQYRSTRWKLCLTFSDKNGLFKWCVVLAHVFAGGMAVRPPLGIMSGRLTGRRGNREILCGSGRSYTVPKSVLEAIKLGFWDFEPPEVDCGRFDPSDAMPGTKAKLRILAERVENGLPLWHDADRNDVEASTPRRKPR